VTDRRKRIQKLIDYRQKSLDDRVKQLAESRAKEEALRAEAEAERQRLQAALGHRQSLTGEGGSVRDWEEASEWLVERNAHRQVAELKAQRASQIVNKARQAVLAARNDVKKLELLDGKLQGAELKIEQRVEDRQHDEIATQLALSRLDRR
jgi:flagellar export protein FliJ